MTHVEFRDFDVDAYDHNRPKKIGEDFELYFCPTNQKWFMVLKVGSHKSTVGAGQEEIALWRSREGLYKVLREIYQIATTAKGGMGYPLLDIIEVFNKSKLDMEKLK